jgi:hypothetical protein
MNSNINEEVKRFVDKYRNIQERLDATCEFGLDKVPYEIVSELIDDFAVLQSMYAMLGSDSVKSWQLNTVCQELKSHIYSTAGSKESVELKRIIDQLRAIKPVKIESGSKRDQKPKAKSAMHPSLHR